MERKSVLEDKQQIAGAILGSWESSVVATLVQEATSSKVALDAFLAVVRQLIMSGVLMQEKATTFLTQKVLPTAKQNGLVPTEQVELRAKLNSPWLKD